MIDQEKDVNEGDDIYYENKYINKLIDANNTKSFNEAVYKCVEQ